MTEGKVKDSDVYNDLQKRQFLVCKNQMKERRKKDAKNANKEASRRKI